MAPLKSNQLVKQGQIKAYFDWYKDSPTIQSFKKKIMKYAGSANKTEPAKLPDLKKDLSKLKKEIEGERSKINEPINEIKSENQDIFNPFFASIANIIGAIDEAYKQWVRDEQKRRQKVQDEIDKKAEKERQRLEELRINAEKNGEPVPPPMPAIIPQVAPLEFSKQALRKSIDINITDKKAFIKYAIENNDDELLDCVSITKTKGIENKARRNPGKVEIPGAIIEYVPSLKEWTEPGA